MWSDDYTVDGSGTGSFTSVMYGLESSTWIYVRAYATNSEGTAYGNQVVGLTSAYSALKSGGSTLRLNGKTVIIK